MKINKSILENLNAFQRIFGSQLKENEGASCNRKGERLK